MDFFFDPKGVAVVGATPTPGGGCNLITNLSLGYAGRIYPVNPKYEKLLGLTCYPRVSEISDPVDLVLVFVPARAVPPVIEDCVKKGVAGAIIESGGFAEVGPEGRALQDRCVTLAREGGLRIWGPNCMGLIDSRRRHVFSFVASDAWQARLNPGGTSLIVQSGLLSAGFIITLMGNKTLSLAKACSIGNKSDVEETELLEYLLRDPDTKVIALYLESFVQGRRFLELASSSSKPIVVLKGGKNPMSAQAAASHTASLAGNHDLVEGALRQAGIHQANDFYEMIDIARTLEKRFHLQHSPSGKPRIAVLSYSGASGIVTTDHMVERGLTLSPLAPGTRKRLQELSPPWMPVSNPVDYWPAIEKHGPFKAYKHALHALHDDPLVDGIIVHIFAGFGIWNLDAREIMSGVGIRRKPILFWLMGLEELCATVRLALEKEGWPVFNEIHRSVRVMASLFEHKDRMR